LPEKSYLSDTIQQKEFAGKTLFQKFESAVKKLAEKHYLSDTIQQKEFVEKILFQ